MAASTEPMAMMMRAKSPALVQEPHSPPWHSPVPYLFGGLTSMLGLIAFAFLIRIAYSFWKLSSGNHHYLEDNQEAKQDLEAQKALPQAQVEKVFVVMAGQERPTFLATPMWSSKSSSFLDSIGSSTCSYNKTLEHEYRRDRETPDT